MTMKTIPNEVLSRARRIRYAPETFETPDTRRGFVWGYVTGILTAIFCFLMMAIPTGAGFYAVANSDQYQSIQVVKMQDVPAASDVQRP